MTEPLARATVEVHADTDQFDTELKSKLDKSVKGAEKDVNKSFDRIGKSASRLGGLFDRLRNGVDRLSSSLSTISAASGIVGSLSSMLAIVGSLIPAVLALAAALSAVAGAVIILPAAFAAVQIVTGTLKLGLQGVGDAMSAIAEGDAKALDKALKGLAPEARKFVREIARIAPQFKAIQQGVQTRLFDDLARDLKPIAENILPAFRNGVFEVAEALRSSTDVVSGFLMEFALADSIEAIFGNVARSIRLLEPAIAPALNAIRVLVAVGGDALPALAQRLATAITNISQRLANAGASGELAGRLQQAIDLIGQLGRIAGNVAGIIADIFFAASSEGQGDDLIDRIELLTQKINEFTSSVGGQEKIRDFLDLLSRVAPIAAGVALLSTAIGSLSGALAFLLTPVGAVAVAFAALAAAFVFAYQNVVPFRDAVNQIGTALAGQIQAGIAVFSTFLTTQLVPALQGAAAAAKPLIDSLGPVLRDAIVPAVTSIVAAYRDQLQPTLNSITAAINGSVTPAIRELTAAYLANKPQVDAFINGLILAISVFARFQAGATGTIIRVLIQLAGILAGQVINSISGLISFVGLAGKALDTVGGAASRFTRAIVGAVNSAVAAVSALPGRISGAIGDLSGVLYGAGTSLVSGFARGIRDAAQRAISAAAGVVSQVRGFFPGSPAKVGPLSGKGWVLYGGRAMSEAFAQGIEQSASAVNRAVAGLAAASSNALRPGGTAPAPGLTRNADSPTPTPVSVLPASGGSTNVFNLNLPTNSGEAAAMMVINRLAASVG